MDIGWGGGILGPITGGIQGSGRSQDSKEAGGGVLGGVAECRMGPGEVLGGKGGGLTGGGGGPQGLCKGVEGFHSSVGGILGTVWAVGEGIWDSSAVWGGGGVGGVPGLWGWGRGFGGSGVVEEGSGGDPGGSSTLVMSPWIWMTPGRGAMACRSTARMVTSGPLQGGTDTHRRWVKGRLDPQLKALAPCQLTSASGSVLGSSSLGLRTDPLHGAHLWGHDPSPISAWVLQ